MSQPLRDHLTSDPELLALARSILNEEEYVVEEVHEPISLVLAENRYFLIGVAATSTIAQLLVAESVAEGMIMR